MSNLCPVPVSEDRCSGPTWIDLSGEMERKFGGDGEPREVTLNASLPEGARGVPRPQRQEAARSRSCHRARHGALGTRVKPIGGAPEVACRPWPRALGTTAGLGDVSSGDGRT